MTTPRHLLASDLDGTLIFDRTISSTDAAAIQRWRDAGHLAACATGKSLHATQYALEGTGVSFDFYVLYTGAVITDATFQVIAKRHLATDVVHTILGRLAGREGVGVFATTLFGPDRMVWSTLPEGSATDIMQTFEPITQEALLEETVIGLPIWVAGGPEEVNKLADALREEHGTAADVHVNQNFIDIVPPDTDKGQGLAALQQMLNTDDASPLRTYAMGDSYNDLHMFQWAQVSAAFPYSPPEVQQAAGLVVPTATAFIDTIMEQL